MIPKERGFALLTALWLVAALTAASGMGLAAARLGSLTTRNRVLLTKTRWAAEACIAIALSRWADRQLADTATFGLGGDSGCTWRITNPGARLNINAASPGVLRRLLSQYGLLDDSARLFVEAILARRPFDDVRDLRDLPGASQAWSPRQREPLSSVVTVDGAGNIDANAAGPAVLLALPGMSPDAVRGLAWRRGLGRPIISLDSLVAELSPPARAELLLHYAELARILTFAPAHLLLAAEGWVGGATAFPRATVEVLVVPRPGALVVIRRRVRA